MKNRKIKFLDYTFIFVMIIYIFIIGSSSTVEANIIFEGFAAPFNNNGNSYCYGYGEKEDFFTNHGWVPGSLYSNDFIESEIFLDDYSAVAYANLNVAPSSLLSADPSVFGEYSFDIRAYNESYAYINTDLPFRFTGTGKLYWGVKWNLFLAEYVPYYGGSYGEFGLLNKSGFPIQYQSSLQELYGTEFGSFDINSVDDFYFSTSFAAGHGGAAYGSFGFAFAAQPFNQFPSEGQIETVVPEPASILLIGIGFCAFGIIGKKKIS